MLYCEDQRPFEPATIQMQTVLCRQVSVSISNALEFDSLRLITQNTLEVIPEQTAALEAARRREEQALHATKVFAHSLLVFGRPI